MKSIVGYKAGMTQVFATDGTAIPVTVVEVEPNVILQVKTIEKDGYNALKVAIGDVRENLVNSPDKGQFKQANCNAKRHLREIHGDELAGYNVGDSITADIFKAGELVDVIGITKGKGFMGVIKTYGFRLGAMGHGSGTHRQVGSMGNYGTTANRVFPGKKMPGHHSVHSRTVLNLQVVAVDSEKNAILIKGAIPGPKKGLVTIRSAVKFTKNIPAPKTLVNYVPVVEASKPDVEPVVETVAETNE